MTIPGIIQNIARMFGTYRQQTYNQNTYYHSTAVASPVTLTTTGSTTMTFGLWNPAGNKVNFEPVALIASIQGTGTQADLAWATSYNAGTAPATAGTVLTATTTNKPIPGNTSSQQPGASQALLPTAATLTAAPILTRHVPMGWGAPATNTAAIYAIPPDLYDGTFIVAPNTVIWLAATAAPGVTANLTLIWVETPV
jgi:hypothetical protein